MKSPTDPSQAPRRQRHDDGATGAANQISANYIPLTSQMIGPDALAALASRMSDGVCLLTAEGRIWYANPAMRALLGRSEAELLGNQLDQFRQITTAPVAPDSAPNADGRSNGQWVASKRVSMCQWRRSDGGVFEARCALEPLADGGQHGGGGSILLMTPIARSESGGEPGEDGARDRQAREAERVAAGRWVEAIEAITDVTLMRLPANDLIEAMLNRIRPALDLENAVVVLINKEGDALETHAAAGAGREFGMDVRVPLDAEILQGVLSSRDPVVVNGAGDLLRESGLLPERLLASMTVHSMLLTPLIRRGPGDRAALSGRARAGPLQER